MRSWPPSASQGVRPSRFRLARDRSSAVRNWLAAASLSNTVGLVVDSALFLQLAFGSLDFMAGQVVGKLWMTVLAVELLWTWRRRLAPSPGIRAG
jgi:uncharacterized PurR-regulated membrane protein YhhQ (DUF165 family)